MSLIFNSLSRFVIIFLPKSKCLLISWLQSPSAVIFEPKKRKCHYFYLSPSICYEVMGPDVIILVYLIFSFKPALSLSSFNLIKRLFSSSSLSAARVVSSTYLWLLMLLPPSWFQLVTHPFLMMYSVYRLNKWGDKRQSHCTPFSILNQSLVPYRVLFLHLLCDLKRFKLSVRMVSLSVKMEMM